MRNWTSLLFEIENYLQSKLIEEDHSNSSNISDLFSGEAGQFIKNSYLNRSDDTSKYFEELNETLWNVIKAMEELGFTEDFDRKLW